MLSRPLVLRSLARPRGLSSRWRGIGTFARLRSPTLWNVAAPGDRGWEQKAFVAWPRVANTTQLRQRRGVFGAAGGDHEDLYEVLGVSRHASPTEVKRAYFNQAKRFHPDLNSSEGARARFQRIAAAYEVLGDPAKRAEYDRTGWSQGYHQTHGGQSSGQNMDDFAHQTFVKVWQDLGLSEYVDTVRSEASTAVEAARHGDYSFAWEFAKERKGLILGTVLPLALILRFPGAIAVAARFAGIFAIAVLRNLPPGVAWALMRRVWIQITRR